MTPGPGAQPPPGADCAEDRALPTPSSPITSHARERRTFVYTQMCTDPEVRTPHLAGGRCLALGPAGPALRAGIEKNSEQCNEGPVQQQDTGLEGARAGGPTCSPPRAPGPLLHRRTHGVAREAQTAARGASWSSPILLPSRPTPPPPFSCLLPPFSSPVLHPFSPPPFSPCLRSPSPLSHGAGGCSAAAATPPPARRGAAVITSARAVESVRAILLRAGRVGSSVPTCTLPGWGPSHDPGALRAPLDEALRSACRGAAPAGRARRPGHAGPRLCSVLGAAAGTGGCAGESPAVGAGSPAAPLSQCPVSPRCRRCFPAGTCVRRGTRSGLAGEPQRPASSRCRGAAGLGGKGR